MTGKTIDEIAASFQSGFTNGNALWDETPEHHKDMFREGVRCAMAALSSVPAIEGGEVKPVVWQVRLVADSSWLEIPEHSVDEFKRDAHEVRALYAAPPSSSVEELRAENERLRNALAELCDAWERPGLPTGGGRFIANVTRAYHAARDTLSNVEGK